jgi:hypothetical protein
MRYLSFNILLFILVGCASDYKGLQRTSTKSACSTLRPDGIEKAWYNTKIDVVGKHLSGLLLIKPMDGGHRIVFTNEAGVTFFDFAFDPSGNFRVVNVIKQLNKKAVITLLQKDFALMLGLPFRNASYDVFFHGDDVFHGVKQKNEIAYFITDKDCASLRRLEWGSGRKQKVTISFEGAPRKPKTIQIRHHTFDMVVSLHQIERNAAE